jgi:hypothetical protein
MNGLKLLAEGENAMIAKNMDKLSSSISGISSEMVSPQLLTKAEALRGANPWFEDIFAAGKTEIHILIVADGNISFAPESDFGLTELIKKALLPSAMPWEEITVVKAHRSGGDKGEDIPGFRFDKPLEHPKGHPLSYYDQIWLFGYESELDEYTKKPPDETLTDSELRELAKFMNNGGGVFAAGDHDDLGAALCGRVPRVRSMRKWFFKDNPPPRNTELRIDTLREGHDEGFQKNDQSDDIPQEIRPVFRMNDAKSAKPHELLRNGPLAITVLPDHMHEGECLIPPDLTAEICLDDGTRFKEYPPERGKDENQRLSPIVVAISTSASGLVVGDTGGDHPPVIPRCYNVIVAYNGHHAGKANDESERDGVGRVVVDASFHHFVNINLKGEGVEGDLKQGFYDKFGKPTSDYRAIKQYFRNIDLWLRPPEKQASYYLNMLLAARYLSPLIEEVRPGDKATWENLVFIGTATQQAIAERFSPADVARCAFAAASTISEDFKLGLEKVLDPWAVSSTQADHSYLLFNTDIIFKLLLGSAMLGLARYLPETSSKVSRALAEGEERQYQLRDLISTSVRAAGEILSPLVTQSHVALESFMNILDASL